MLYFGTISQLKPREALEPAFRQQFIRQQFIRQQVHQAPPGSGVRIIVFVVRLGVHEMTVRRDLDLRSSGRTLITLVDHSKFGVDAFCQIVPLVVALKA